MLEFAQVMGKLRVIAFVTVATYRFWQFVIDLPALILRVLLAIVLALFRKVSWWEIPRAFVKHVSDAMVAARSNAQAFPLVRLFAWLQLHPVSQRSIKMASFLAFAILSAAEILTS